MSVALDWTPNTNHTGIYVAQKLGYYTAAGIDLKILPYASTAPETLVSHGKADFGFSYSAGVAFARAAGADVTSVFAVLQHTALEIGVRADRTDIKTPKDLDGKTYAGFGTPDEKPLLADRDPRMPAARATSRTSRSTPPPTTPCTAARPTSRCRSRPGRASRRSSWASR